jgi:hypothetical protein
LIETNSGAAAPSSGGAGVRVKSVVPGAGGVVIIVGNGTHKILLSTVDLYRH